MNQESMKPMQAFEVLAGVASQIKVTLQEGDVVRQALQVVHQLVKNAEDTKEQEKSVSNKK